MAKADNRANPEAAARGYATLSELLMAERLGSYLRVNGGDVEAACALYEWDRRAAEVAQSHLATVLVAVITSNTALAAMPGNVFLSAAAADLPRDSVVNVTAVVTLNKSDLSGRSVGYVPENLLLEVDRGLRCLVDLRPAGAPMCRAGMSATDVRFNEHRW